MYFLCVAVTYFPPRDASSTDTSIGGCLACCLQIGATAMLILYDLEMDNDRAAYFMFLLGVILENTGDNKISYKTYNSENMIF